MPQVMNGCGTWYYGKRNRVDYEGVCRACGHQATLTSYDTRLYVVIIFVPVIPLAAKRIVEQCSVCTRHAAVPLDDWNRAIRRARESADAYRAAPTDPELAREALAACVSHRGLQSFLVLAPEVEQNLARDATTLRLLAAAYDLFARPADAERCLRAALAIADEEETREALADCLLRQDRPADAEPLLQHIVEKGIPDRAPALFHLAQGYQIAGDHAKALAVFDQCAAVNPLLGRDENFVRLREASAKTLGTNDPVRPADVVRKAKSAASLRRTLKVAPAVIALAFLAYVGLAWIQGRRREVFLVSGIDRPYTVRLNGVTHSVAARSVTPIRIAEGDAVVEIIDPPGVSPAETVCVRTPLLSRPFDKQAFVINPDHAAVLQHGQVVYSSGGGGNAPEPTFSGGRALHEFDRIDYAFEEPPRSLQLSSHSDRLTKHTLRPLQKDADIPPVALLAMIGDRLGPGTVAEVARRHILLEPEHSEYLQVLSTSEAPRQVADFLRPLLARRPLQVQWHRAYQNAMTAMHQDDQIAREYDAMLAADPANKDLMYLAGRAYQDLDKSVALCRKAVDGDAPSGYAAFSLSAYHLANGEFPDAVRYAQIAARVMPNEEDVRAYLRWALIADGQLGPALAMLALDQAGPLTTALPAYAEEVVLRGLQNDRAKAQIPIDAFRNRLGRRSPEMTNNEVRRLQASLEYAMGMLDAYARILEPSTDPADRFCLHVTRGDATAADRDLAEANPARSKKGGSSGDGNDAALHLITYLLADRQGRADVADRHLATAADLLAKGRYEERIVAAALGGKPDRPIAEIVRLRGHPTEKRLWLAALGFRDPAARDACFALGRKLNVDPRFPHRLLRDVFNAPAPANR